MPGKRTAQEIAQDEQAEAKKKKPVAARRHSRRARPDSTSKAGTKRRGTQRETASQIAARNAQIVVYREVHRLMWEEIGEKFGISEKTARRGYDAHVAAREHETTFERAMRDMREYVAVLMKNQQVLARIAHELEEEEVPPAEEGGEPTRRTIRRDVRERIAAMHEMADQMFKEIAVRQAIGDLPLRFSEMAAARDFEWAIEEIMAVLKEHNVPRKVFVEIERRMQEHSGVPVPKTHLSAVE